MRQDVVYALRNLRRHPLVGAVAILTLGLGIGGATAVFSVVDAVLMRPLPFAEPAGLVRIHEVTPDGVPFSMAAATYLDLADGSRTLQKVAAFREAGPSTFAADGGDPQRLYALPVTASLLETLGVRPALGRFFTADEDRRAGAGRVIVVANAVWAGRLGGDPKAIGRRVQLNGEAFTIVGVMPAGFDFPGGAEAWIPLGADRQGDDDGKDLAVIGRLAPGATLVTLRDELRAFGRRLSEERPASNRGWSAGAVPFDEWLVAPRFRDAVWVLFGAVGLLLLLACANVANLLIAHGAARQAEMRIRSALGAGRDRLVRQLFTESALLAILGTIAGVLVSFWSIAAIHALGDNRMPRVKEVGVDATVLVFACLAGIVSCLVFGLLPAMQTARVDLRGAADAGVRHTARGRTLRGALVVAEVALALVLLVGAGLLANSFVRLLGADSGFDAEGVLSVSVPVAPERYPEERLVTVYADLIDAIRVLPGVTGAAATTTDPFRQGGYSNNVTPEDRAASAPPSGLVQADWRSVTPGFFDTLRIPVVAGRAFEPRDREGAERVVVINESLARQLWPGGDAVGKRVFWGGTTGRPRLVVGVTRDIQDEQLDAAPGPMLFVPHAQVSVPGLTLLVRTTIDAPSVAPAIRAAVRRVDPLLPVPEVHAVSASRAEAAAGPRFNTALLGAFAAIAFVLAVTGVYALLTFSAIERRRELAIRAALGASGRDIVRMLVGGGLVLAGLGITIGLAAAAVLTRVLGSLLYGIAPTDPWTFGAAAIVLLAAAALAGYLPARRAGTADPLTVLRN